jgi:uncharacterized protein involved in outer membrane biogenesis
VRLADICTRSHWIRKRWLRKILLGVLILAGIVAVVLFYLTATLNIEAHRAKIKSIISHSLDRQVRIDGKIGMERSLWPRFVVEDISIGNDSPIRDNPIDYEAKTTAFLPRILFRVTTGSSFMCRLAIG